ncbi:O-antigen polymerase [Jeotgalibacillus marinus]|uniref:O-antigen polymerase n=1 Tax=Jeotgalibacillus marinus TaxID=86667 RepID=A0ABV3Q131_9BACL
MKIKKGMLITVVSIFLLKVIFDYLYFNYVSQYFVIDLFYLDYSLDKHVYSYLLLFVVSIFVLSSFNQIRKPSNVVILIMFLCIIIPLLTLYGFQNASSSFVLVVILSFVLIIVQINILPTIEFKIFHRSLVIVLLGGIVLIYLYVYSYLIFTGGLLRFNFNLEEVYDIRSEYAVLAAKGPLLGYFITWVANVFNIGILSWGLFKKNKKFIIVAIILQLFLFGMTNFKSFLFAPCLVIFLYIFTKNRNLLLYSVLSVSILLLISYFSFVLYNDHQWSSMFIRRQFFTPSNLHLIYYDFFSHEYNPFIYLSNSIFQVFLEYPYQTEVTKVISWEYWGKDGGPNVGFFANAYSNFGYFGIFIFSAMLGFILKILDSLVSVLPHNLIAAFIAIPAFSLVNSGLFTTLLTHGFLVSILTLLIMGNLVKREGIK